MAAPRRRARESTETAPTLAVATRLASRDAILEELRTGLRATPKHVAPRFLYDATGSRLFDLICRLPEYYPTRTETGILRANLGAIVESLGERVLLVEPGSGSSRKTRLLLDAMPTPSGYVPVDISRAHLLLSAQRLKAAYPRLEILPVCADFMMPFPLPLPKHHVPSRIVFFFPGSTVGNLERDAARALLAWLRETAGRRGGLLVGVDLVKDPAMIERAYNDRAGITAQFNLNVLAHLNREYGADFDLSRFRHRAAWDAGHSRIEMQLVSACAQRVQFAGETLEFAPEEPLRTEFCHKYDVPGFGALARSAGWDSVDVWTDPQNLFSVHYLIGD